MSCPTDHSGGIVERKRYKALLLRIVEATAHLLAREGHSCAAGELFQVLEWEEEVRCTTPPLRSSIPPSRSGSP